MERLLKVFIATCVFVFGQDVAHACGFVGHPFQPIIVGQTITATNPGPSDCYQFSGTAGQPVTITVSTSDAAFEPILVKVWSFSPAFVTFVRGRPSPSSRYTGSILAQRLGNSPQVLVFTPPATGNNYAIEVSSDRSIGFTYSVALNGDTACTPDTSSLCLDAGRFRVTATWSKSDGTSGQGTAVTLTSETGYFWFFDSANVELVVKVLEGCSENGNRWVFASGLTNVGVEMTVTDAVSGVSVTYNNTVDVAFQPIQDTSAFPCN